MTLVIKPEYKYAYPRDIQEKQLQYVNSHYDTGSGYWYILATCSEGNFHKLKSVHVTKLTKLEVALG